MATVSYYLAKEKKDKKGRAQIMLQCVHNGQRFRYYTGKIGQTEHLIPE
jgi:hypothetical protein